MCYYCEPDPRPVVEATFPAAIGELARLRAELAALSAPQPCGHAARYAATDGKTEWCALCELEKVRIERDTARLAIMPDEPKGNPDAWQHDTLPGDAPWIVWMPKDAVPQWKRLLEISSGNDGFWAAYFGDANQSLKERGDTYRARALILRRIAHDRLVQRRHNEARAAAAERELEKWRNWHPDDEHLALMQQQARSRDGSYTNGLAASHAYAVALEGRLRDVSRERDEARAALAEMRELLKSIEWRGGESSWSECPCCCGLARQYVPSITHWGHREGCALAAALLPAARSAADGGAAGSESGAEEKKGG